MSLDLYVRKQKWHDITLWWICQKIKAAGHKRAVYVPYADIYAPTGYGFKSKAQAERVARELEQKSQ